MSEVYVMRAGDRVLYAGLSLDRAFDVAENLARQAGGLGNEDMLEVWEDGESIGYWNLDEDGWRMVRY